MTSADDVTSADVTPKELHNLLQRQLNHYFGDAPTIPQAWQSFLEAVSDSYALFDAECAMLKRTLDLRSHPSLLADKTFETDDRKFRAIFAQAPVGIAIASAQGYILESNPAKQELLGYSAGELRGMHFRDYTHPDDIARDAHLHRDLIEGRRDRYELEKRYLRRDGEILWGRVTASLVRHPDTGLPEFIVRVMENIHTRKLTEEVLSLRDRAIAASSNGIVIADARQADIPMIYVNPAFERMTGYSADEAIGRNCRFLQGNESSQPALQTLRRAIQAGESCAVTLRNYRKDGSLFWNELSIAPVRDEGGRLTHFIGIQSDITQRVLAETRLRESAQQDELINQLSYQIRNSLELDTILETAVDAIRNLLELDRCLFAWHIPDETYAFWEVVKEAKNPDLSGITGHYADTDFGTLSDRLVNMEIVRIDDAAEVSDFTLQHTLIASNTTSLLVLPVQAEAETLGAIWCHACDRRIWNDLEVELLETVGAQLALAISQSELYEHSRLATANALAQAQKLEKQMLELQRIETELRESEARSREQTNQLQEALNELQRTQSQLIQTEKMSGLGQLVAGVAHEINNPVNFIHGNINHTDNYVKDLLELVNRYHQEYPEPSTPIQELQEAIDFDFLRSDLPKTLASMKMGAERIRQIVLSLRNFSRLDEAEMKPVDIHEGLDSTLLILQNRLKGIVVEKSYSDLPLVECYAGQLNQVFMNILTNAIDALEQHGVYRNGGDPTIAIFTELRNQKERIDPRNIHQHLQEQPYIAIHIRDNGIGIPPEVKERLFDPFFTTKPVGKGTGLGLSIVHQIVVQKHEGRIECLSEPGKGTEFTIEIPFK